MHEHLTCINLNQCYNLQAAGDIHTHQWLLLESLPVYERFMTVFLEMSENASSTQNGAIYSHQS